MPEELSTIWDKGHMRMPIDKSPSPFVEDRESEFKKNSVIAELGGGTGADAVYLLQHGHKVIELDISPVALQKASDKAKALGLSLETRRVTIGKDPLPVDDESLDGVYSRLALHYFDRKTTIYILKEIYSKLKAGGKAYLSIKSPADEKEMEFLRKTAQEIEPGVFNDVGQIKSRFTIEQLQEMLEEAGIESSTVKPYVEDLSSRVDVTKSGNQRLLLNEISFTK